MRDQQDQTESDKGRQGVAQSAGMAAPEARLRHIGHRAAFCAVRHGGGCRRRSLGQQQTLRTCRPPAFELAQVAAQGRGGVSRTCQHGQNQYAALGHRRVISRHIEHQQGVDHHHQNVGPEHGSGGAAATTAEHGAAQHDGGEHLQQHRCADQRVAGAGLCADEDAGQPVAGTGGDVQQQLHGAGGDACGLGRGVFAADGVHRHA